MRGALAGLVLAAGLLAGPGAALADAAGAPPMCSSDEECFDGAVCVQQFCQTPTPCVDASECWTGYCDGEVCREPPPCVADDECGGADRFCVVGACQWGGQSACRDDAGCPELARCGPIFEGARGPEPAPGVTGVCRIDGDALPTSVACRNICDALAPCSVVATGGFFRDVDLGAWIRACGELCTYAVASGRDDEGIVAELGACLPPQGTCAAVRDACGEPIVERFAVLVVKLDDEVVVAPELQMLLPSVHETVVRVPTQADEGMGADQIGGSSGCAGGGPTPPWGTFSALLAAALAAGSSRRRRSRCPSPR